jgi:hypothetical protein
VAGRTSGDAHVDITSAESIEAMYRQVPNVDAVVGIAASGALDEFDTLTEEQLLDNMRGKFFGQVNLVLIGQRYVNSGGSFTLTSGVFADVPANRVTGGAVVSGALHSFVLSAAHELEGRYRVNVVSPTMVGRFGRRVRRFVSRVVRRSDGHPCRALCRLHRGRRDRSDHPRLRVTTVSA